VAEQKDVAQDVALPAALGDSLAAQNDPLAAQYDPLVAQDAPPAAPAGRVHCLAGCLLWRQDDC